MTYGSRLYKKEDQESINNLLQMRLGPEYVSSRPGAGGGTVKYLEAHNAIELANKVFGFNGWSSSIVDISLDYCDEVNHKFNVGVSCIMRITLPDGSFREDIGYGTGDNIKSKGVALDKAKKEAVTDAIKRVLRTFGNCLGNCLYDKDYNKSIGKVQSHASKSMNDEIFLRPNTCRSVNNVMDSKVEVDKILKQEYKQEFVKQETKSNHHTSNASITHDKLSNSNPSNTISPTTKHHVKANPSISAHHGHAKPNMNSDVTPVIPKAQSYPNVQNNNSSNTSHLNSNMNVNVTAVNPHLNLQSDMNIQNRMTSGLVPNVPKWASNENRVEVMNHTVSASQEFGDDSLWESMEESKIDELSNSNLIQSVLPPNINQLHSTSAKSITRTVSSIHMNSNVLQGNQCISYSNSINYGKRPLDLEERNNGFQNSTLIDHNDESSVDFKNKENIDKRYKPRY